MRLTAWLVAAAAAIVAPASVAAQYSKCGLSSSTNFASWTESFSTDSPVMFPTNEAELASIVSRVRTAGCKLRVVGTAHSFNGVVRQKLEQNTVVVNLGAFTPSGNWNNVINPTGTGGGAFGLSDVDPTCLRTSY